MVKMFQSLRGKHGVNKAYTMIEMMLVIILLSIFLLIIPPIFKNKASLNFTCEKIKSFLLNEKILAITLKEERNISIAQNYIQTDSEKMKLGNGIYCDSYTLKFNARGNVNMGGSIHCYSGDDERKIVINLGSGNIYVK